LSRIVILGGIESTYRNAQLLHDLDEEIVGFYTRGAASPGWEGVDLVDEARFPFAGQVPRTEVNGNINEYADAMRRLQPDFVWSLGWQQRFGLELLSVAPVLGIHESLLPEGAGAVPIANAILHDRPVTGVTLFEVDRGIDTGPILGQLRGLLDPRQVTSTELYEEAMVLEDKLIRSVLPFLHEGLAPRIPQDRRRRTCHGKITWDDWPVDRVRRARTYPYR